MLSGVIARARSLWRGARRRAAVDIDMQEEFRSHIEMRSADLQRHGVAPADAVRQARLEFGSVEHYKDRGAESRGLRGFDGMRLSLIDFKLGARMLAKYPGLTIVGGIAIAFAVAVGTTTFELMSQYAFPKLPVPNADRVVVVGVWNTAANRAERRIGARITRWRRDARTLEDIGGVAVLDQNLLMTEGDPGTPVPTARTHASAFRLAGAQPLLGRGITDADEARGGPDVAVIGYELWRDRFASDSGVIGRHVRIGRATHTIVGVMPYGFTFPDYRELWLPLRTDASANDDGSGPPLRYVFARLAPGATIAQAEAELRAIDARFPTRRASAPSTLRTRVLTFAQTTDVGTDGALFAFSSNTFLTALLALVFANVALLVLARAATRESELVVRTALGATRMRIIMQLFAEALVLSALGAVVGLSVAAAGWRVAMNMLARTDGGHLPFWLHPQLSNASIAYSLLMVLLCSVVTGVMPALKLTGGIDRRLRQAAAGTRGLRFSGVWTVVIVAQIAITIAFPVTMFFTWRDAAQVRALRAGVRGQDYLIAQLSSELDDSYSTSAGASRRVAARAAATMRSFEARLEQEPDVAAVTFATLLPGMDHPQRAIELDGDSGATVHVSSALVAEDYFSSLGKAVSAGRSFRPQDADTSAHAVIVNATFVRVVLHGRNPLGQRVRFVDERGGDEDRTFAERAGPWHTIVGVVDDLGMTDGSDPHESGAGVYQLLDPDKSTSIYVAVRSASDASALGPRMRAIAAATDPTLRLTNVMRLDGVKAHNIEFTMFWFRVLGLVTGIALMLSLASIYSVMAFAVAQRTREIGVRVALGAEPGQIIAAIFARPLRQVALGVAFGAVLVTVLVRLVLERLTLGESSLIAGYGFVMWCVCLLACVVPTRRALAIEPTEALKAE